MEDFRTGVEFIRQDPWPVLGFILLGTSGLLFFRFYTRLTRVGLSRQRSLLPLGFWLAISRTYLQNAEANGWSRFAVYASWLCLVLGFILLGLGLARL